MDFDVDALFDALDTQRRYRGLSWQGVAQELWDQSALLNARRHDLPTCAIYASLAWPHTGELCTRLDC
jgi:hypothetical protein